VALLGIFSLLLTQVYDDWELVEEGREELAVELEEARGACLRYPHRDG
jgi:hypothetical protein